MKNKKTENKPLCQLCLTETKEKVEKYIGGFVSHAHPSCAELALNAIRLYERYVLLHYKLLQEDAPRSVKRAIIIKSCRECPYLVTIKDPDGWHKGVTRYYCGRCNVPNPRIDNTNEVNDICPLEEILKCDSQ